MYTLEELEQQNSDIANLCQVLLVLVREPQLRGNPYVCDLVSRFYDKVWMHLMFEDKSLYAAFKQEMTEVIGAIMERVAAENETMIPLVRAQQRH